MCEHTRGSDTPKVNFLTNSNEYLQTGCTTSNTIWSLLRQQINCSPSFLYIWCWLHSAVKKNWSPLLLPALWGIIESGAKHCVPSIEEIWSVLNCFLLITTAVCSDFLYFMYWLLLQFLLAKFCHGLTSNLWHMINKTRIPYSRILFWENFSYFRTQQQR